MRSMPSVHQTKILVIFFKGHSASVLFKMRHSPMAVGILRNIWFGSWSDSLKCHQNWNNLSPACAFFVPQDEFLISCRAAGYGISATDLESVILSRICLFEETLSPFSRHEKQQHPLSKCYLCYVHLKNGRNGGNENISYIPAWLQMWNPVRQPKDRLLT